MVELLAMAHERACEAELAHILEEDLAIRRTPCLSALRARFSPDPATLPKVVVEMVSLSIYDGLIEQGEALPSHVCDRVRFYRGVHVASFLPDQERTPMASTSTRYP